MGALTLRVLRETDFPKLYRRFILHQMNSSDDLAKLLQSAFLFLSSNRQEICQFGYRLTLFYAMKQKDFDLLFKVAQGLGYYPVLKLIQRSSREETISEGFCHEFSEAITEAYNSDGKYLTRGQNLTNIKFKNRAGSVAVVAPTSYGKSELITSSLRPGENICILVPTLALLAQTKKRVLRSEMYEVSQKIVTHHEMYNRNDNGFIAILTQERLLKLLESDGKVKFHSLFIDEAHNLLVDGDRERFLAMAIILMVKRNADITLNFLTPFLNSVKNLKVNFANYDLEEIRIKEFVKAEKIFLCDTRKNRRLFFYDQFMDKYYPASDKIFSRDTELIREKAGQKNIVYINRPVDIETFTLRFIDLLPPIYNEQIETACNDIAKFLHKDYTLIKALRKGVVFHHGSVPDNVRLFVEYIFSQFQDIKHIVTNSTLLEGVNIPAEKIFILSNKKGSRLLAPSQVRNLAGRICRFSEVFRDSNKDLSLLAPEMYVIGSQFTSESANLHKWISESFKVDKELKDKPSNVLLEEANDVEKLTQKAEVETFLENLSPGITEKDDISYATTDVGRLAFRNNVTEIDILKHEKTMQAKINEMIEIGIEASEVSDIIFLISDVFVQLIPEERLFANIRRLLKEEAMNFYSRFLEWRIENKSYSEMIYLFKTYWDHVENTAIPYAYVGKWGDDKRDGHRPNWINLKKKTHEQKINLIIAKIKDEQDFVDNKLMKFVEILNDSGLISYSLYVKLKYGTSDLTQISMLRNGFGGSLATLLREKYSQFIVHQENGSINLRMEVLGEMEKNKENMVLVYEASFHVR